jgi:CCR4-NOT transcription complex subunit 7/8
MSSDTATTSTDNAAQPSTNGPDDTTTPSKTYTLVSETVKKFTYKGQKLEIRDVYSDTLSWEMAKIREVITTHKYVAMDLEFGGVVARPISAYKGTAELHYNTLRMNVDLLKPIQLGLTFCDENGNLAPNCPCWQFNFKFNLNEDIYSNDSIELLKQSGIQFEQHALRGIDTIIFAEMLMTSGLVLSNDVCWIVSFSEGTYFFRTSWIFIFNTTE